MEFDINKDFKHAEKWIEDGYPIYDITTKEEFLEQQEILDEALVMNHDFNVPVDADALNELAAEVEYAGKRHWTFQWIIIAGAILSVILLNWLSSSKKDDIAKQEKVIAGIEAWQPSDTTLAIEVFKTNDVIDWSAHRMRASYYKTYKLQTAAHKYYGVQKSIDNYLRSAQNTSDPEDKEKWTKRAEELKAEQPQNEKAAKEEYDKINAMGFEEIKAMALNEEGKTLDRHKDGASSAKRWFWFLIICIPLYIFACRPYGYTLNRYTAEAKTLNLIQRIGLWASGALLAGAAALQFTTIVTKWSDGRTTESDDGTGPMIAALKIGLMIAAVLVFCFMCCFIMAFATIAGLIRNYDWKEIFATARSRMNKKG